MNQAYIGRIEGERESIIAIPWLLPQRLINEFI